MRIGQASGRRRAEAAPGRRRAEAAPGRRRAEAAPGRRRAEAAAPAVRRVAAAVAATSIVLAAAACSGSSSGSTSSGSSIINGAGSTFAAPMYQQWAGQYKASHGVLINYQAIGSGGGIAEFTQGVVNFGATDAPMTSTEQSAAQAGAGGSGDDRPDGLFAEQRVPDQVGEGGKEALVEELLLQSPHQ